MVAVHFPELTDEDSSNSAKRLPGLVSLRWWWQWRRRAYAATPPSCAGTGPVGSSSFPILGEVEPNDDISMAFGVMIPTPGPTTAIRPEATVDLVIHSTAGNEPLWTFLFLILHAAQSEV